ncbi:hypothetical protein PISMIDRAFT_565020 [Pisolithus microcarpus 441]|uniref:Uncharacterized protein n=1 Tax=Pisolithus microcarpus 441 TaxID=765257 RepID=A0A0C9ZF66_9AGAM|nr:hypothetical protein BKA83DRAFT_565020 [Pisolithus microcarpus]KIK21097.1 hypothetical protein PISMIDRAFT_565020 [Pisolithus microcarpus 441]
MLNAALLAASCQTRAYRWHSDVSHTRGTNSTFPVSLSIQSYVEFQIKDITFISDESLSRSRGTTCPMSMQSSHEIYSEGCTRKSGISGWTVWSVLPPLFSRTD